MIGNLLEKIETISNITRTRYGHMQWANIRLFSRIFFKDN